MRSRRRKEIPKGASRRSGMFGVPKHAAVWILAREHILFFCFSTRLPTRSNYLPPAKEIKGWGRRRSRRRSRLNAKQQKEGENRRSRKERKRDIWRKGRSVHVCVCSRENISPISGCRVSGYAQRVITLSWRILLLAYVHAVLLPSPPPRLCLLFRWTIPTPSSSCSNGAPLRRALLLPGASPETKKYDSPREKMA